MAQPLDSEPSATSAGEQDHSDPWAYAGEDADAPTNEGTPAVTEIRRG